MGQRHAQKFIFLDRDGVINEDTHHPSTKAMIRLIPRSGKAIKLLNEAGYTVIVITNQAAVAKGIITEKTLATLHRYLQSLLHAEGARMDHIYYCPHHPQGIVSKYTKQCDCRKPKPGLLLKAQQDLAITNMGSCFMIGDKIGDIAAGRDAGCKTVLVSTGYGGAEDVADATPDYTVQDLFEAVEMILGERNTHHVVP